ncbi:aspartic peptidase domain-containing protein [Paraphoma chrysanthemicola]|uniref:Aspartic peptidase domain-containing protein n=1 Tax=Paraphoma chrysanthemicola TaxID=798071 RepID=A0A8K0RIL1_9PLEO|nr:aspartic peptidase domain-containing protein [Paraphoma chrysanthemicola]
MSSAGNNTSNPFVFTPSQSWSGNDGRWSTFIVRVGTPEQNFGVLPGTGAPETIVVVPDGCTPSDPTNCGEQRGAYPFNGNSSNGFQIDHSTSWKSIGLHTLDLADNLLGDANNGLFGTDSVGLMLQNSGGLKLENQVVAGIATKDFYLGVFGLGIKPSNFTDYNNPVTTFMQTLKDENRIPSLSYAYTAGAAYRLPQQYGSLTLGGYDTSRFIRNNQTFPFSDNDSKRLSVGVQKITATNTLLGTRSLISGAVFSVLDSTVPHIWLPRPACDAFEQAFGLTYDNDTDLYLINDTIHAQLQEKNPTITFSLGNDGNTEKWASIAVPYGALDLQASHPLYDKPTNYFPIRRAANETQYTLGRTFFQEAYVISDYERSNFSVHQARFESPMPKQEIITITSPSTNITTNTPLTPASNGLPTGAIVGIVIGVVALLAILSGLTFCWRRRRRQRNVSRMVDEMGPKHDDFTVATTPGAATPAITELHDETKHEMYQPQPGRDALPKGRSELSSPGHPPQLLSDDSEFVHKQREVQYFTHEMPANGEGTALHPTVHELGAGTTR